MAPPASFSGGLVKRLSKHDLHDNGDLYLDIWIYFNLIANTLFLPLLVATFLFSKRAKRHATLVNVLITWIFSGIFSLLLFYGDQYKPHKPNEVLCIAQASLLYGITPMWSVAIFVMIYHMYTAFDLDPNPKSVSRAKLVLMLGAPYIAECIFSLAALVLAVSEPNMVTKKHEFFYCSVPNAALEQIKATFTGLVCFGIVIVEGFLIVRAYRSLAGLRRAGLLDHLRSSFILRIFFFGLYIIFGIAVNIIDVVEQECLLPDLFVATGGTVIFLVFGSQADVLKVWSSWLPHSSREVVSQSVPPKSWSLTSEDMPKKPPNALVHNPSYLP